MLDIKQLSSGHYAVHDDQGFIYTVRDTKLKAMISLAVLQGVI